MVKKVALFDLDGSLADYESACRRDLEALQSRDDLPLPENLWDCENIPYLKARMKLVTSQPDWWVNLERNDRE